MSTHAFFVVDKTHTLSLSTFSLCFCVHHRELHSFPTRRSSDLATPGTVDVNQNAPLELGVKFEADSSGFITGIRFYKGVKNRKSTLRNFRNVAGSLLAFATLKRETSSGWQQVNFASPVPITPNT